MYGMMPSAKTATRAGFPRVKVLTNPRKVLCMDVMNSISACGSTPGVGM